MVDDPDFNRSDEKSSLNALVQREQLIEGLVKGTEAIDTTLDCLAEQGINPDDWIDATLQNIDYVLDNGVRFFSNDKGLFLPERFFI